MRIWMRIFILTTAIAVCAIALTGIGTIRTGSDAIRESEIRLLTGESRRAAALIANRFQAVELIFTGSAPTYAGSSPVANLLRESQGIMPGVASNVEVFTQAGDLLYSEKSSVLAPISALRPEIAAGVSAPPSRCFLPPRRRSSRSSLSFASARFSTLSSRTVDHRRPICSSRPPLRRCWLTYLYNYDKAGNWVLQIAQISYERKGTIVYEPPQVSIRTIEYSE